jgi:drug/metabolite transporter (DMT)-like permease
MTLEPLPLVLVLISALMHAGWNLIAKLGNDRLVAMAIMKVPNIAVATAILVYAGLPVPDSWPFLLASWAVNCLYFYFLIRAYRGDLSLAYPVARGVAPLFVLGLSAIAAREVPTPLGVLGVLLISTAIFALVARRGAGRQYYDTLMWAGGVGLTIAIYTVIDGLGGRKSGNPVGYVAALNILTGIAICGTAVAKRGQAVLASALRSHWRNGLVGGTLMLFAYMIVVYALTLAPMAQVAALRESSVIFAAIMGVIFLREPFGAQRVVASVVVAVGIALLALGR